MEGNLFKWTNFFSQWKERFCILKGEVFYYYENKGEKPKGKAHLGVCTIEEEESNETRFGFHTGSVQFFFRAESKEQKREWVQALKLAKLNSDRNLLKAEKNEFNFNKYEIKDFPNSIKELYNNISIMFNYSSKIKSEFNIIEQEINKSTSNYNYVNAEKLKKSIASNYELCIDSVQLAGCMIKGMNEFSSSLNKMNFIFGGKGIEGIEPEVDKNYEIKLAKSGIVKNDLDKRDNKINEQASKYFLLRYTYR